MNLRSNLIRLAYANPSMRKDLLPIVVGDKVSVRSAARPLGPGVHLIEELPQHGRNVRLVFRELGGDILGSEETPGYYLDFNGILKLVVGAMRMSPAGEVKAKKAIIKLMGKMGSTKTAGGRGADNAAYLSRVPGAWRDKVLKSIADHYGTSIKEIEDELTDPDAEAVYDYIDDRKLKMQVYRDFNSKEPM
jgi:hypothetical protein